jgi:hypothetical protein
MTKLGHERVVFAAMHGRDLLYSAMLGLGGKPVKRREFITLAPAQQPARCRLSRSPSAQREAQMLVRLSIIGAFAAILMLPTTLSAQINPGGAINPGGGFMSVVRVFETASSAN